MDSQTPKRAARQRKQRTPGFDPHRQHLYHGRAASNITCHLKQRIPTHSFDPETQQERHHNPAAYRKKASSITGWMEPHPKLQRPVTAPLQYFGRRPTSVTGFLRQIPPQASLRALPYFGKHLTSVTDPSKCNDPAHDPILTDRPARRHCSDEPRDEETQFTPTASPADQIPPTGFSRLPATPRSARASNAPSSSSSKKCYSMKASRGSVSCPSTPRQKSRPGAGCHASLLGRAAELLARGAPSSSKRTDEDDGLQSSSASVAGSNLSSVCDSLGAERAEYVSHWAGQLQSWGVAADRRAQPLRQSPPALPDYSRRATSVTKLCIF